MIIMITIMW